MFSDYDPTAIGEHCDANVRVATRDDLEAIATLRSARNGRSIDHNRAEVSAEFGRDGAQLFIAELEGAVVAFGRCKRFGDDAHPPGRPTGWYLSGIIVQDEFRRRGIGRALVDARVKWLRQRADIAWALVARENRASLDMLEAAGFEPSMQLTADGYTSVVLQRKTGPS